MRSLLLSGLLALSAHPGLRTQSLLLDANPAPPTMRYSNPIALTSVGGRVVMAADDGVHGDEPWITDGTAAGTRLLADIAPGAPGSVSRGFAGLAGGVLFTTHARYGYHQDLWFADLGGRAELLGRFAFGVASKIVVTKARAYFTVEETSRETALWTSDGTPAGTRLLRRLGPRGYRYSPVDPVPVGDSVVVVVDHAVNGHELWGSDGTPEGTQRLHKLPFAAANPEIRELCTTGTRAFCTADDGVHGRELWTSDGTPAGTYMVVDLLPPLPSFGGPGTLVTLGARVLFVAGGPLGNPPAGMYASDGTPAGTVLVGNVPLGSGIEWRGRHYYGVFSAALRHELWATDGTRAGTSLVATLPGNSSHAGPARFCTTAAAVTFELVDTGARVLWLSDGTAAGTRAGPSMPTSSFERAALGARLVFAQGEPWITDGTAAGTGLVATIAATARGSDSYVEPLTAVAGTLWFGNGTQLWATNGTPATTRSMQTATTRYSWVGAVADTALFSGPGGLWSSDGTPAGTQKLWSCAFASAAGTVGSRSGAHCCVAMPGPFKNSYDYALFTTGGTPASTVWTSIGYAGGPYDGCDGFTMRGEDLVFRCQSSTLAILAPGDSSWTALKTLGASFPYGSLTPPIVVGSTILFGVLEAERWRLWRSDGTPSGTWRLMGEAHGSLDAYASLDTLAVVSGRVLFFGFHAGQGATLWSTDGTSPPRKVAWFEDAGRRVLAANGIAYCAASDGEHGMELWRSDGTPEGTALVCDAYPGRGSGVPDLEAVVIGATQRIVFAAQDATAGVEPWSSDGTASGTKRMADLNPGAPSSWPSGFVRAGDAIYFMADDGAHGRELWVLPVTDVQGAYADRFGRSCGPAAGAVGAPVIGSLEFALTLDGAAPGHFAVWLLSPTRADLPLLGCTLYPHATGLRVGVGTDRSGRSVVPVPIPADPRVMGQSCWAQAAAFDGAAFRLSDGVAIRIGR